MPLANVIFAGALAISIGHLGVISLTSFQTSNVTGETRHADGVRDVVFSTGGTLIITQGSEESLLIEADEAAAQKITTRISGTRLVIESSEGLPSTNAITYRLTVKDLSSIELTGEGRVESDGFSTSRLRLITRGAGDVRLDQLTVDGLRVATYGVGSIDLSGTATQQDVEMYGAGIYRADRLSSSDTTIELRGSGRVSVQTSNTLDARIWGSGTIEYSGNPSVSQGVSGSGRITHRG
jgi:hypothetical protein